MLIRTLQHGWGPALAGYGADPVVWLVTAAPLALGLLGFFTGRELDRARHLARRLDAEIEVRNGRLAEARRATNVALAERARLLDQIEEGVAYFDAEGRLGAERSPAFERLIPHAADVETVDQLLEPCGAETETVAIVRLLLWDHHDASFEATTAMLPRTWATTVGRRARFVAFHYRPVRDRDGRLQRVMMIVVDQTALGELRAEHDKTLARIDRLGMAAADVEGYASFVDRVHARLEAAEQARKGADAPSPKLLAILNSLKTTMGLFAYGGAVSVCHQLEIAYSVGDRTDHLWAELRRLWRTQAADVAKTLGLERGRMLSVAPERLVAVRQALGVSDLEAARRAVLNLRCHPVPRVMGRYTRYVSAKSEACGKQVRFVVADSADEVAYHEVQRMDEALIHLFNNVVTHAAVVGAVVQLTVGVLRREDGGLRWMVEDDGAGIDGDRLAARAVQAGLRTEAWAAEADHQAKLDLVFLRGMTTTATGDELAGTGRGLPAARACMRALGGDIRVASAVDAGTRFELWVPGQASMDLRRWHEPTPEPDKSTSSADCPT